MINLLTCSVTLSTNPSQPNISSLHQVTLTCSLSKPTSPTSLIEPENRKAGEKEIRVTQEAKTFLLPIETRIRRKRNKSFFCCSCDFRLKQNTKKSFLCVFLMNQKNKKNQKTRGHHPLRAYCSSSSLSRTSQTCNTNQKMFCVQDLSIQ